MKMDGKKRKIDTIDVDKPKEKKQSDISVLFGIPCKTVEKKNFGDESSHSKKSERTLQSATAKK